MAKLLQPIENPLGLWAVLSWKKKIRGRLFGGQSDDSRRRRLQLASGGGGTSVPGNSQPTRSHALVLRCFEEEGNKVTFKP